MYNSSDLEKRITKLNARHNILLTKGGTLNKGEIEFVIHIENELRKLNEQLKDK